MAMRSFFFGSFVAIALIALIAISRSSNSSRTSSSSLAFAKDELGCLWWWQPSQDGGSPSSLSSVFRVWRQNLLGTVIAGDSARSRFELRVTDRSSDDAVGNHADRVEFRYRDSNNRIDLKCSRTSVPATWLTVSHISGHTLISM